jgi:lysophospholipase L1-like esterase
MSRQYVKLASSKIIFDGNSITEGSGSGAGAANISAQVSAQLIAQKILGVSIVNIGVGGQTCAQMIADGSSQIAPLLEAGRDCILVANEGGNDIYFGATAAQAFQNIRDYCLLRRSEGFYVLVWSCPYRNNGFSSNPTGDPTAYQAALLDFNNRLANGWKEFADAYMDTRKHFPYAPTANYPGDGGFWFPDCVHPSATGNAIIAAKLIEHLKIPIRKKVEAVPITYRYNTSGLFSLIVPAGYTRAKGKTIGGPGGAGSGRKGAAATARFGGAGGAAAATNEFDIDLAGSGLGAGSILNINIGAAGTPGAAVTINSTNGNNGTTGGATWIRKGASGTTYISYSNGGNAGAGGTATTGTGGAVSSGQWPSTSSPSSSATAAPSAAGSGIKVAGAGGAGGGISTGNVAFAGGTGGRGSYEIDPIRTIPSTGGAATGANGGNGGFPVGDSSLPGDGGGGGGGNAGTTNGGTGGTGGGVAAPGGGGGAATDGTGNSGAGGLGTPGYAEITFY